jgi:hypothetical protein
MHKNQELQMCMAQQGRSLDEVDAIFREFDEDGDDLLNMNEFENLMAASYHSRKTRGRREDTAGLPLLSIEICAQNLINRLIKPDQMEEK